MSDRSSFHFISGDGPLTVFERITWYLSNIAYAYAPRPDLNGRIFRPSLDTALFPSDKVAADASPSRVLSDLLWHALPAQEIREALGGSIRVLDIGCGRGHYVDIYDRAFGGLDSYTGVDADPRAEWAALQERDKRVRLIAADAARIDETVLGDANVIVSQSALEHVRDDLRLFRTLAAMIEKRGTPVFQLHLVPGQNLWRLWGTHGYRGYHETNLKRLADCFDQNTDVRFAVLGGRSCNAVHVRYLPGVLDWVMGRGTRADRRLSEADNYVRDLSAAVSKDRTPPSGLNSAHFIGLVLQTRMSVPLPAV